MHISGKISPPYENRFKIDPELFPIHHAKQNGQNKQIDTRGYLPGNTGEARNNILSWIRVCPFYIKQARMQVGQTHKSSGWASLGLESPLLGSSTTD